MRLTRILHDYNSFNYDEKFCRKIHSINHFSYPSVNQWARSVRAFSFASVPMKIISFSHLTTQKSWLWIWPIVVFLPIFIFTLICCGQDSWIVVDIVLVVVVLSCENETCLYVYILYSLLRIMCGNTRDYKPVQTTLGGTRYTSGRFGICVNVISAPHYSRE